MKNFLASLGLERYCQVFEEAEVDMGTVDIMEESDYAQLGVAKVYFFFFLRELVDCLYEPL